MEFLIEVGVAYLYAHAVMDPITLLVYLLIGPPLNKHPD